jgi:GT2 family glycosyltransferase
MSDTPRVGVVVIGRNEGDRLKRCLQSVIDIGPVVYVDSGSTDDSVAFAKSLDVDVVAPDLSTPFTAARARNAGWRRLAEMHPDVEFVQFVDGDCEVDPLWLMMAFSQGELQSNTNVVAVCGRRHERSPEESKYNRLCDLEWDTPIGFTDSCGGDVLMRLLALRVASGYRESLIAGEEPELCYRLRKAGYKIKRIDAPMTYHDAGMTTFRQWWTRAVRAGHAYAEVGWLHREDPDGIWRREVRSTWFWGIILPAFTLITLLLSLINTVFLLALWIPLIAYLTLAVRIYFRARKRWSSSDAELYTNYGLLAKFAHAVGLVKFHRNRWAGRKSQLIEYKQTPVTSAAQ